MIKKVIHYFKTGPNLTLIEDREKVRSIYESKRLSVFTWLILGYGFFYTCRLSLSVAKKPMLDAGIKDVTQMGLVGAALLYVYAFGKCFNGFLADRANIRKFMSIALFCSAIVNILFGLTSHVLLFAILWMLNGWFQSIGSAPSVVSLCQWFSHQERGRRYGIWAGAHNLGEGLTFLGTAAIISYFGWQYGFIGPGIACVAMSIILFYNLADRPQTYGLPHVSEYCQDFSAGKPSTDTIGKQQFVVLKSPIVWIMGISCALMYVGRYAINSWGIFYLQTAKGYGLIEAGAAMALYPLLGFIGAVLSGWSSEKFFNSRRNVPTLFYGLCETTSLVMLYLVPPGHFYLDAIALGLFGFGIGGLIVFLAGLIAVDLMPKGAVGAVKGIIGLFSYMAAATQDWISGLLISAGKTIEDSVEIYDFRWAFYFWIGSSILSMAFALGAWNKKPRE